MRMKKFVNINLSSLKRIFVRDSSTLREINKDVIYQFSPVSEIFNGNYEYEMSCGEIRKKGDFGIGTFEGLDGQMVILNGKIYQIKDDGIAYLPDDTIKVPYVAITCFQPDFSYLLDKEVHFDGLTEVLDKILIDRSIFYAIKVQGKFKHLKVWGGYKQSKPYLPLKEVLRLPIPTFDLFNVEATLVGFWCPQFAEGLNVPGYHFHCVTLNERAGGHVDECIIENCTIEIDEIHSLYLDLPVKK